MPRSWYPSDSRIYATQLSVRREASELQRRRKLKIVYDEDAAVPKSTCRGEPIELRKRERVAAVDEDDVKERALEQRDVRAADSREGEPVRVDRALRDAQRYGDGQ